ncbi:hypothetical protein ANN_24460 [Periplaneta americana]|uniref:Reverse transcriptase domain-containing protein n=1 Tax=Periplaneta americana TaxID=6978 RepID=A0ABQ8S360_PERAM|nr:hypothetical protein ANN_24460 [Periplaneta americana]
MASLFAVHRNMPPRGEERGRKHTRQQLRMHASGMSYPRNMGGVIVRGRRIKCITFADDMASLAEEEMILKDMLLELNDSCEQYGMKISTTETWTLRRSEKKRNVDMEKNGTYEVKLFWKDWV